MKKFLSGILGLLLVFSFITVGHAQANFPDQYDYAEEAMNALIDQGVLKGDGKGNYFPGDQITRAEFAAFVVRSLDIKGGDFDPFPDVSSDRALYDEIHQAAAAGIVNGYPDGTFHPDLKISREQMAVMINRVLSINGVVAETKPLTFTDKNKILQKEEYLNAVKTNVALGIIKGYLNNTFRPKNNTIRANAAVVIYRVQNVLEKSQGEYSVASISSDGDINKQSEMYQTFDGAKRQADHSNEVVFHGNKIVWMKDGLVHAGGFTVFYETSRLSSDLTYVSTGTELKYLESGESWVKVQLGRLTGYIKQDVAGLKPSELAEKRSYYTVDNDVLYHHIVSGMSGTYSYGPAPDFLQEGKKYYSWDGHTFKTISGQKVGTAYQYFNLLPLNTKTSYTAEDLNRYVKNNIPDRIKQKMGGTGPLASLGDEFIKAQGKYGVNALYLLAHAIHESAWGSSCIAQERNNIYGYQANDGRECSEVYKFDSYQDSVNQVAQYVINNYQDPDGQYYYGAMLGNKAAGMNVKYASDAYWGQKIAGYMYRIDKSLGGDDFGKYNLGIATADSLNVRPKPSTSTTEPYQYPRAGAGLIIKDKVENSEGKWFKITSENSDFRSFDYLYTYNNGQYGQLAKDVSIAK
ncbi:S-layer homology domain-containing protein [Tuberibacillus sp. Marseille-P3662]|uniref:S-layer homology domain-containing protein n=1 Tax=Tuberibacillus sp. Marseille-P3662 TaxID=1965358 RepID=UPI001593D827|nr:S-layer homology domain-containing protein [Tuberibacillus sp. Marseille-P3662]